MSATLDKPLSKKAQKEADKQEAITQLRAILKPGDTVYCILRHVSSSGMSRIIDLVIPSTETRHNDTKPSVESIGWLAARAMSDTFVNDKHYGIKIGGCGMDMGFALVYNLGHVLFPDGFAVEGRGRNGDTSGWDKDGGYALKHRWL